MHGGLERAAARLGDRPAVLAGDEVWTFAELDGLSNAFAHHLAAAGVGPGDRVAVMSSNRVELVLAVQGASRLGAAAVMVSPAWKATEVANAVALTEPVHAVADGAGVALLAEAMSPDRVTDLDDPDTQRAITAGPTHRPGAIRPGTDPDANSRVAPGAAAARASSPGSADDSSDHRGAAAPEPGPDADAVLVFSSGTTGMPKAVRHTHASMGVATDHWVHCLGLTDADRFQVATPPTHILGLLNLLAAAEAGATVRLHARFDLDDVLRSIEADRLTLEMAVAPIALAMANHPDLERYDLSSLRYVMWGATPVTASVAETVTARTGVRWLPAYGASELPVITCNPVDRPDEWRLDSAGLPAPGVELRVVDLDTGDVLPAGATGEIQARSASVMAGYLPAEATADAFDGDWYRTGDIGWLEPDGWVHLTDRSKEMIKVKGFQVAPAEVEAVLLGHPSVVDCAVFGVPDEAAGEVPVAAVVLDPAHPVEPDALRALVADTLATYKQLRQVEVVDTIPRLPSGKALRRVLRDQWLAGAEVPA
ncbi:MAG: acyl--CoA ligase [Acidimicrobiales bacterium]|nr:acyl--CoA ligase [Acidimicrobiales bacterium]